MSVAAVERALAGWDVSGRVRVGDALVSRATLEGLRAAVRPGVSLAEATRHAREAGIDDVSSLLSELGLSARWRGLSPEDAVVVSRANPSP